MYTQFFASYLVKENYISKSQIIEALKSMKKARVKLGVLAMNAGFLNADQVERIHQKQTMEDKRFGDIALELEYLTSEQIDELVSQQPSRFLTLVQTLSDKEYMSNADVMKAFQQFKEYYGLSGIDMSDSDDEHLAVIVKKYYNLKNYKHEDMVAYYIHLLFNNLVRFVGDDFIPVDSIPEFEINGLVSVHQPITGEFDSVTGIETDELTFIQFASLYAGEELPILDDMSKAAVEDFLNLHNGLFLVNESNEKNIELNLSPTVVTTNTVDTVKHAIEIPILLPFGKIRFSLS